MSKAVLAWLGLLFVAMGGTFLWLGVKYSLSAATVISTRSERDKEYQLPPLSAGDAYLTGYTLTERNGRKLGTKELAGKVYVTNFFFSTCPAECLRQSQTLESIQRDYGPKGVQFVSITCDPDIDTPAQLSAYADKHFKIKDDSWWFLTGDMKYIERIAGEFYEVYLKKQKHTERFEVRDKWGNPRGSYEWKDPKSLTELKLKLNSLLAETEPPADVKAAAEERAAMIERANAGADKVEELDRHAPPNRRTGPLPETPQEPGAAEPN